MRIVTLDSDSGRSEKCDMEPLLQERVSSSEGLGAARWQMLLELIRFLGIEGPLPEVWGLILRDELCIYSGDSANRVTVNVRVDWVDYAPLRSELPDMHYRLQIKRQGAQLSQDARTKSPDEVQAIIRESFGWSK